MSQYQKNSTFRRIKPPGSMIRVKASRKTRGKIWRDWIYRIITALVFLFSMTFISFPVLVNLIELAGNVFYYNKALGGLAIFTGGSIIILFCVQLMLFNYRDLSFESSFAIYFTLFFGIVLFANYYTRQSIGIREILNRYENQFNTAIQYFKNPPEEKLQEAQIPYIESPYDSLAFSTYEHESVKMFMLYASQKYYNDQLSFGLYLGLTEVMSLYRVILEEFKITSDYYGDTDELNPERILEIREANQMEITLIFGACLKHLDYPVRIRKNIYGRLVTEMQISTSTLFDLDNFLIYEEWNYPYLKWYMQEHIANESNGLYYVVPLYLPHKKVKERSDCASNNYIRLLSSRKNNLNHFSKKYEN